MAPCALAGILALPVLLAAQPRADGYGADLPSLQRACEAGQAPSCVELAYQYEATELAKAASYYQKACELGNAGGCMRVGTMYDDGEGVPRDRARAVAAHRRGCAAVPRDSGELDYPRLICCYNLGVAHEKGDGVAVDAAAAGKAFGQSFTGFSSFCATGHAESCYGLGLAYALGRGAPQDMTKARAALGKACKAGHEDACNSLKP